MTEYEIKRWDGVMFGNSITKVPMIYITPDIDFLEFIKANNYAVSCDISGTGMVYDEVEIPGVVDQSSSIPNCRPNFYEKSGYYVVTLMGTWNGYPHPNRLGKVVFSGLKAPPKEDVSVVVKEAEEDTFDREQNIKQSKENFYVKNNINSMVKNTTNNKQFNKMNNYVEENPAVSLLVVVFIVILVLAIIKSFSSSS